jgi:hypothetical protein
LDEGEERWVLPKRKERRTRRRRRGRRTIVKALLYSSPAKRVEACGRPTSTNFPFRSPPRLITRILPKPMATFIDLADDCLRDILSYLPHKHGKARFAFASRRARAVHVTTVPARFEAWARELSRTQRYWIAGLGVTPPIRAGFESGTDCGQHPLAVLRAVGETDSLVGRLVAYQAALLVEEEAMMEIAGDHGAVAVQVDNDSFFHYYDTYCDGSWEGTAFGPIFEFQLAEPLVVFIALGFLTESRIEELLVAELSRFEWAGVFATSYDDMPWYEICASVIDPLFSFARWKVVGGVVTGRYELMQVVRHHGRALLFASDELKGDREVVLVAVADHPAVLEFVSEELKSDREVVLVAVSAGHYGDVLCYASEEMKADREVVMAAVQAHGDCLEEASVELKADREVVLAAVTSSGDALEFASKELKSDREIVLVAVSAGHYGAVLCYASDELKADLEVVMAAVQSNGQDLEYASEALKADRGIVMAAVRSKYGGYHSVLRWASEELKADREIVMAAIAAAGEGNSRDSHSRDALKWVSGELRGDLAVVTAAVAMSGVLLQWASEELRGNREVVLTAVGQNGLALQFASEELRLELGADLDEDGPASS